jgi:hypothetical protein
VPKELRELRVLRVLKVRFRDTQEVLALKVLRELKALQHQLVMICQHIGNQPLEALVLDRFHFRVQTHVVLLLS